MKRTLIAASLVLLSGSAFASEGFPKPSFDDGSNVPAQVVTSTRTFEQNFPQYNTRLGGPTGPATVLLQSLQAEKVQSAILVAPSFNG